MKVIAAFVTLLAVAVAAPPSAGRDKDAVITRYDSDNIGIDGYSYTAETSNGIAVQEQGQLQNAGTDHESLVVRGSYTYVGTDGKQYTVTYIADENGFQPQGAHLPVPQQ